MENNSNNAGAYNRAPAPTWRGLPIVSTRLKEDACICSDIPLKTPKEAIAFVGEKLYDNAKEMGAAIFMDSGLRPICAAVVGQGNEKESVISTRDIVQIALLSNASYVTLIHNHPSKGTSNSTIKDAQKRIVPSVDDIRLTESIAKACSLHGIEFYDSVIVGGFRDTLLKQRVPVYFSMREKGFYTLAKKAGVEREEHTQDINSISWGMDGEKYWSFDGKVPGMTESHLEEYEFLE